MTRRIAVVTGSRAEYGLLKRLIDLVHNDPATELQLLVTGSHLAPAFGTTVSEIERDGYPIAGRIPILDDDDDAVGVSESTARALAGFAKAFNRLRPDLVVVLGDRSEVLGAAAAALFATIPIAHIHGGETTEGAYDEAVRHAVTKMAHLHFTAAEPYRQRVIQLGEDPARVFTVGAPGLDAISALEPLSREELEADLDFRFGEQSLLVTYHPETAEGADPRAPLGELLAALDTVPEANLLFTLPNADAGGRALGAMIEDFVQRRANAAVHASLGQLRYLSALRQVSGVVGNTSSGIIEAPSCGIGTLDIGARQAGRLRASSVLWAPAEREAIADGLAQLLSTEFRAAARETTNPYGQGDAAKAIFAVLRSVPLEGLLRKRFRDLPVDTVAGSA